MRFILAIAVVAATCIYAAPEADAFGGLLRARALQNRAIRQDLGVSRAQLFSQRGCFDPVGVNRFNGFDLNIRSRIVPQLRFRTECFEVPEIQFRQRFFLGF